MLFTSKEYSEAVRKNISIYGLHERTFEQALRDVVSQKLSCHESWFTLKRPDVCEGNDGRCCCGHCCTCG